VHPILTQPTRLLAYVAVWSAFGLLIASVLIVGNQTPVLWAIQFAVPLAILLGFQALSSWYMVQALPASETPWPRLIGTWLGTGVVLIAVWLAAGLAWASFLMPNEPDAIFVDLPSRLAPLLVFAAAIGLSVAVLSHYLMAAFERSRLAEKQALQSKVHARDAELRSLRSQLDPHFLFNSLNSVAALIGSDAIAARRMCLLLATFCRKSISLGREASIRFEQELELIETFLAIEAVRFAERLRPRFDIADDTRELAVPPLMLQPLVENAIHHGIAHMLEGGEVSIAARRRDHLLELVVENPFDPEAPRSRGAGVGINNVRSRIDTLYGHRASIEVDNRNQRFRVTILMPATPAPNTLPSITKAT
jgi:two-component system sensor histidine kinase AlgZ